MSVDDPEKRGRRPGLIEAWAPGEIERRSFAIIEEEAPRPRPFSGDSWLVARRIVHAAGDLSLLDDLSLPERSVQAGLEALRGGAAIFTDTEMVRAGIPARRLEGYGCQVRCVLDAPGLDQQARALGRTRISTGFQALGEQLAGCLAVIGNAPTGLLAILDYLDRGGPAPALIIGMPVGFVNAAESKELLLGYPHCPSLVLRGRRGGSALAAAAVNALAAILAEREGREDPMRWTGPAKPGV